MMKKKGFKFVLLIVLIVLLNLKVEAATCDSTTKKDLKKEAQHISVTTELKKPDGTPGEDRTLYYYDLHLLNVSANMTYEVGDWLYQHTDAVDGELYISNAYIMGGYKVAIKIYASSQTACSGELLKTIYVNLPRYNLYSDREECKGLSDYFICKTNSNTEGIEEEEFLNKIKDAKKKKAEKTKQDPVEEEKEKYFENAINFFKEKKNIIIPILVIVSVLIIIIIIIKTNKNKNKIKIDLGDELE